MEFLLQRLAIISRDVEAKEVEVDCTRVFEMFAVNTFIVEPLLFSLRDMENNSMLVVVNQVLGFVGTAQTL